MTRTAVGRKKITHRRKKYIPLREPSFYELGTESDIHILEFPLFASVVTLQETGTNFAGESNYMINILGKQKYSKKWGPRRTLMVMKVLPWCAKCLYCSDYTAVFTNKSK